MQKLLLATSNPGKVAEYKNRFSDLHLELVSLKELGLSAIEETGKTFQENAILKARTYFQQSGLPCIADDGGLEIDYLNGEPGVYSARWISGKESSDAELVAYTLQKLKGVSQEKRTAQLRLVVAFADKEGEVHTAEALVKGYVAQEAVPHEPGFPYRGVLFVPQFNKYLAQLSKEEHELINQRFAAIRQLKPIIQQKLL